MNLRFNDGFRFGCGFFLAGIIAWLVLVLVAGVVLLVMAILGLSVLPLLPRAVS
jgi:hypothetical protein